MRNREIEFSNAVIDYLHGAGGAATIGQIRKALPHAFKLAPEDRRKSITRPGEEIWEQQVRNIVCHRNCEGNPVNNGTLIYSPGRLTLADSPQGDLFL